MCRLTRGFLVFLKESLVVKVAYKDQLDSKYASDCYLWLTVFREVSHD